MSKYLINGESIEAIADGFRTSRGTEQKYTLDEMAVLAAEKVGGNSGGGGGGVSLFESYATGCIPKYDHGYATAELNVTFTASATGANS